MTSLGWQRHRTHRLASGRIPENQLIDNPFDWFDFSFGEALDGFLWTTTGDGDVWGVSVSFDAFDGFEHLGKSLVEGNQFRRLDAEIEYWRRSDDGIGEILDTVNPNFEGWLAGDNLPCLCFESIVRWPLAVAEAFDIECMLAPHACPRGGYLPSDVACQRSDTCWNGDVQAVHARINEKERDKRSVNRTLV